MLTEFLNRDRDSSLLFIAAGLLFAIAMPLLSGCTSTGHERRSAPKIAKAVGPIAEFGFDSDDNELSVAVEKMLDARGIRAKLLSAPEVRQKRGDKEYTYDEVQTRFVLKVRSIDLDRCVPEGSRQMHFQIAVTDFQTRQRVFLMKGEFGCRDTLVREFEQWLNSGGRLPDNSSNKARAL
jgi:hypothetical protein